MERLDVAAKHDLTTLLFADFSPHGLITYAQTSAGSPTGCTPAPSALDTP